MTDFYSRLAPYYDNMYSWKDYAKEADLLHSLIQKYKISEGSKLLDVGCGTGCHIEHIMDRYEATGLDINESMLQVARSKCKSIRFFQGDMTTMDLGEQFDVIISLFGSLGYLTTKEQVKRAMMAFAKHTKKGGVALIEPFITKEKLRPHSIAMNCVDLPEMKIARVNSVSLDGSVLNLNFHFLIATKDGVEHFVDPSPMGIFLQDDLVELMSNSGFSVEFLDMEEPFRGLLVGVRE